MRALGMPVAQFVEIVLPQILAGEPYVVSHGFNLSRIAERQQILVDAYRAFAAASLEDDRYDVSSLLKRLTDQGYKK